MAESVAQPDMPDAPEDAAGLDDPGHAGLDDPGHGPWWMRAPSDPPASVSASGGYPIVSDDPSNTGGYPIVPDDLPDGMSGTGGFPVIHDEPVASGGYPIVSDESLASGGYPVVRQDAYASGANGGTGGYPIMSEGSLTSGGYPVLEPGPQTSGGYPVMPSDRPRKKRSTAGVFGAIFAVGVGLVIVAVAGYLILKPADGRTATPVQKKRVVGAAGVAGGLNRTTALPAATAAYPFVMAGVRAAGADEPGNAVAVYSAPLVGPQQLLFVGGVTDTGDPLEFLNKVKPSTALTANTEAPGKGGGQAVCGTFQVLSDVHVYCAWATKGSFGVIATNMPTPIPDIAGMAALMGKMRGDLDKRF
ncbi:hypothetical protein J4573_00280 [Actinomadura barringtoniae]|uniref:Uncharacterized protein n=1 Tax=Actinomadura barringtoniae TaxID=1427535 RepID=A0A939P912_9ACTN|nr:hypothetical protein [Actinomadura barringtoniae]MBO2445518.1 hypothetical protein [Actinomadura barringtoniae]